MRSVLFAALFVLLLGAVAHAEETLVIDDSSDFGRCFCWNASTNSWCAENGKTSFNRISCNRYFWKTAAWTIPAVLYVLFMFFFPFVFCMARMLCNCCGGRKPSYGCCCPVTATEVMSDVGAPLSEDAAEQLQRPYSNRTIFFVKLLTLCACAGYVFFTVAAYQTNDSLHSDTKTVLSDIQTVINHLYSDLDNSVSALTVLENNLPQIIVSGTRSALSAEESMYGGRRSSINDALEDLQDAESNYWGRQQMTVDLISLPTCLFALVILLMLFNIRGGLISFLAGLMAWATCFVSILFIATLIVTQVTVTVCDNYDTTFVPFVSNIARSNGGCASSSTLSGLNMTGQNYANYICSQGLRPLCSTYFTCPVDFCRNSNAAPNYVVNTARLTSVLTLSVPQQGQDFCASGANCASIATCALNCNAGSEVQYLSQKVMSVYGYNQQIATLNAAIADTKDCTYLINQLNGPINADVCGSFQQRYRHMSVDLLACSVLSGFGLLLFVLGAKRYTKLRTGNQPLTMHNFVYGVLVTTPDGDIEVVGTPLSREPQQNLNQGLLRAEHGHGGYGSSMYNPQPVQYGKAA